MAIYKCKMCGGDLEIVDEKIMKCEFCETTQTVPTSSDENLQGLFNRANILRMKGEFDKAEQIYEKIIEKDETQAEAYWGLILCKYGIEYVEDPVSFKRIPTCHRASFDSVIADEDYKSALNFADSVQHGIYESEAKEIDRIQKEILELSQREEPYDVFICYKETDSAGARTQDSVIANDIYHQLTQEGFKVFYAAITLENKLGKSYEPCIFAALNSAKVMLAIGTKPEYFTAVWVKNEWSRFLKIIQKDRSKLLIPCYRDMDAYELPEEFAHLQAQDMSKIGFISDIVRGIKKVVAPEVKESPVLQPQVIETVNANAVALLDRGFMALEDSEWEKADDFFEQSLNFDAKIARAYLGKLMAELRVKTEEDLIYCSKPFDNNGNYQKALRFADDALKAKLEGYANERTYIAAVRYMEEDTVKKYEDAIELFAKIPGYKDADELKEKCNIRIEELIRIAEEQKRQKKEQKRQEEKKRREELKKAITPHSIRSRQSYISARRDHTVGLKSDGTVVATKYTGDMKYYHGECDVRDWSDIVAVSAGLYHTVGLKYDGTVVATKYTGEHYSGQCDVQDWSDIVAVSAGSSLTVGLKSDGTVVAVGIYRYGQCDVQDWSDIVAVSAGSSHTVGLKSDGTVVAVGYNLSGQCDVRNWTDIVAVSAGFSHTVGLKSDGTVVAVGSNADGQCDVQNWSDIVAVSAGDSHTVGLKSDGTVVATKYTGDMKNYLGQCDVQDWSDIVAVSVGNYHTVGLKSDGTVVAVGYNNDGQCDVRGWTDIDTQIVSTEEELEEKKQRRREEEEQRRRVEEQRMKYRTAGVCQHCGGKFKGLFTKTCVSCGKTKDY